MLRILAQVIQLSLDGHAVLHLHLRRNANFYEAGLNGRGTWTIRIFRAT